MNKNNCSSQIPGAQSTPFISDLAQISNSSSKPKQPSTYSILPLQTTNTRHHLYFSPPLNLLHFHTMAMDKIRRFSYNKANL